MGSKRSPGDATNLVLAFSTLCRFILLPFLCLSSIWMWTEALQKPMMTKIATGEECGLSDHIDKPLVQKQNSSRVCFPTCWFCRWFQSGIVRTKEEFFWIGLYWLLGLGNALNCSLLIYDVTGNSQWNVSAVHVVYLLLGVLWDLGVARPVLSLSLPPSLFGCFAGCMWVHAHEKRCTYNCLLYSI